MLLGYGVLNGQQGHLPDAVKLIRKALAINPDQASAHGNLGNCYKGLGQHKEALACYDRALTLSPDASTWSNRGATLLDMKQYAAAIEDFDHALALEPGFVPALDGAGKALVALERYGDALARYMAEIGRAHV